MCAMHLQSTISNLTKMHAITILLAVAPAVLAQNCPKLEIVYARATTEPPTGITAETTDAQFTAAANRGWSKGYGAAGMSFVNNVTALIPDTVGYPVPYPVRRFYIGLTQLMG
jgi:hypothetical protein